MALLMKRVSNIVVPSGWIRAAMRTARARSQMTGTGDVGVG
jgi:hypothetical protein